jgi:ribosomal-protein-alanine N-acetyltransferase
LNSKQMELRTARLVLRPWRHGDEGDLVREADDPRVSAYLRDLFPSPYRREDADHWIAHIAAEEQPHALAITLADRPIGGIGIDALPDVFAVGGEIGYWVGVAHWGQGYASEAVGAMVAHAFATLGLLRVQANVYAPNVASARVLEKNGFELEGTLRRAVRKRGEVLDVKLYARVR